MFTYLKSLLPIIQFDSPRYLITMTSAETVHQDGPSSEHSDLVQERASVSHSPSLKSQGLYLNLEVMKELPFGFHNLYFNSYLLDPQSNILYDTTISHITVKVKFTR